MKDIILAEYAGFCFGVKRAVDTVHQIIEENENASIYTLGTLIHNPTVVNELTAKGVCVISEDDFPSLYKRAESGEKIIVVIRTHGISREISSQLFSFEQGCENFKVFDLTCPYVKKIHKIVSEQEKGTLTLIFGDKEHPEVKGIDSFVQGKSIIFSSANELEEILKTEKKSSNCTIMVSQTTQNMSEWKKCQKFIQYLYTNTKIFDTICSVTENRQNEADELSKNVDVMIIVGGKNSSNTHKLFLTAQKNCPRTYLVEDETELDTVKVKTDDKIGITAGASTPEGIIQEVIKTMSEKLENKAEESFEQMLNETFKTLNTGDVVTGVITSVSQNEIHVDLGTKVTGILSYDDITDDPNVVLTEVYKVGDTIEAVAVRVSDIDGVATLSKKRIDAKNNWGKITAAYESGEILNGKYIELVKGGIIMLIDGIKVFVPASHTTLRRDADLATLIGKKEDVKIIEVNDQRRRAKASARIVVREARRAIEDAFWSTMEIGKIFEGTVRSLTSYGAFVSLADGIDGMVHASELSWRRIKHPSEIVSVGDVIRVFVKDFDREKNRISLGYKTEETNPWTMFINNFAVGDTATVKIVNMMPFGAFAEIVPGVDGLIHISQIANKKIGKPEDVLEIGQTVDAKIIEIDEEKHNVGLSIRALIEEEEVAEAAEAGEDEIVYSDEAPADDAE